MTRLQIILIFLFLLGEKTAITNAYYDSDYEDVVRNVRFGSKANEVKEKHFHYFSENS